MAYYDMFGAQNIKFRTQDLTWDLSAKIVDFLVDLQNNDLFPPLLCD